MVKCPRCNEELSSEDIFSIIREASEEGLVPKPAGRPKGSTNSAPRADIGKKHRPPKQRKQEEYSELKARTSAENGRKFGGRPKGSKNKAPRADKGVSRGPRNISTEIKE